MPFNEESAMQVVSIISTKGGVGKTTTAANLGGFAADAGLRVLLLDLDVQPTLSSYFTLELRAPAGVYEMLAFNERRIEQLVSRTAVAGLELVVSNDDRGELNTLLLHAPDGRLRLRHLLPTLAPLYDLVLIDTQGARSVLLEMAVLASDLALSPVTPEILAARELRRGTLQLIEDIAPYRHLGIEPPPLHLLINRVHPVSSNARLIQQALRQVFQDHAGVRVLDTDVPAIEAYPRAATRGLPVHRVEFRHPAGRVAPSALQTMRALASELFPQWRERFALVTGRPDAQTTAGSASHGERP
jgi:chromosome partitioning related protein ParA